MKHVYLLFSIVLIALLSKGQVISPDRNNDYCPGVNIAFTVTIAGQSVQSVSATAINVPPIVVQQPFNISVNSSNITFSFVGRFVDNNNKQTFTINYINANGQPTTHDFTFNKIKSLLTPNSFSQIFPTPTSIIANRCQVQNFNISFANVQYGNPWETPPIGYGTVNNYEYLLPAGWSLNGNESNGTSWITGDNNEMITSDASSGNGAVIRIRPINTQCGIGLYAGQQVQIPISRPRPPLSISGDDVICSGTVNYTIAGTLPPGATVCWTISSPNGAATIPSSPFCGTILPVSYNSVGSATITATITDCIETYSLTPKVVVLGTPALPAPGGLPAFNLIGQRFDYGANGPGNSFSVCTYEALTFTPYFPFDYPYASIIAHQWTITGNYSFASSLNQGSLSVLSAATHPNAFQFTYRYQNACGWSPYYYGQAATMNCDGGEEPFRGELESLDFTISPNPANNFTTLQLTGINSSFEVRVFNVMTSKLERLQSFEKGQTQVRLNLGNLQNGNYVIHITSNGITKSKQLKILR